MLRMCTCSWQYCTCVALLPGLPQWLFFGSTIYRGEWKTGRSPGSIIITTTDIMRLQFECKSKGGGAYVYNCDAFMQLGSSVPPTQDVWVYSTWLPLSNAWCMDICGWVACAPPTMSTWVTPTSCDQCSQAFPNTHHLPLLTHTRVKAGQVWEQG